MFPAFDLNHSYEDCDVFVSIAKMKEHATAGITLSMKNCFGLTPCTIYGTGAGVDEPSLVPKGGRNLIHAGQPAALEERAAGEGPQIAAAGHVARAAHGGRSVRRAADSPGDRRGHQDDDRRRGSVDSRRADRRRARRDRGGVEPGDHGRGVDGADGLRSDGRSRHAAVRASATAR